MPQLVMGDDRVRAALAAAALEAMEVGGGYRGHSPPSARDWMVSGATSRSTSIGTPAGAAPASAAAAPFAARIAHDDEFGALDGGDSYSGIAAHVGTRSPNESVGTDNNDWF